MKSESNETVETQSTSSIRISAVCGSMSAGSATKMALSLVYRPGGRVTG